MQAWVKSLCDRLLKRMEELPEVIRNGDSVETYHGCVNLSFAYVEGNVLILFYYSVLFKFIYDGKG